MKIVFLTSENFALDEVFLYMFAKVADRFNNVHIVAVRRATQPTWSSESVSVGTLNYYSKKLKRLRGYAGGVTGMFEHLSLYPVKLFITRRNERKAQAGVRALPRPPVTPQPEKVVYVDTVNGPDAVEAISKLQPDVVIQFGAGILRKQIFEIPRIGTLNLHPGIAPLIKGMDPIYWALWQQEPKWMGATVHFIDEGIDTGPVLAYAPVAPLYPGEPYPSLFVRVYKFGVKRLVDTLLRLAQGERWTIHPPQGERIYRSTISGWKLCSLEVRDALRRRVASLRDRG